jgi:hypothetical protein
MLTVNHTRKTAFAVTVNIPTAADISGDGEPGRGSQKPEKGTAAAAPQMGAGGISRDGTGVESGEGKAAARSTDLYMLGIFFPYDDVSLGTTSRRSTPLHHEM